jgi:stringent starvation protein B
MSGDTPSKKDQLLKLLDRGSVFVHLDPRREGVTVPPWFCHKPQLVLQLGRNFAIPIPDLEIDEYGVSCTLSFNRTPFHCMLPWDAIYALVAENGEVTMWSNELPSEFTPEPTTRRAAPTSRSARGKARPKIAAVPEASEPAKPARVTSLPPPPRLEDVSAGRKKQPAAPVAAKQEQSQPQGSNPVGKPTRERPAYLRLVK